MGRRIRSGSARRSAWSRAARACAASPPSTAQEPAAATRRRARPPRGPVAGGAPSWPRRPARVAAHQLHAGELQGGLGGRRPVLALDRENGGVGAAGGEVDGRGRGPQPFVQPGGEPAVAPRAPGPADRGEGAVQVTGRAQEAGTHQSQQRRGRGSARMASAASARSACSRADDVSPDSACAQAIATAAAGGRRRSGTPHWSARTPAARAELAGLHQPAAHRLDQGQRPRQARRTCSEPVPLAARTALPSVVAAASRLPVANCVPPVLSRTSARAPGGAATPSAASPSSAACTVAAAEVAPSRSARARARTSSTSETASASILARPRGWSRTVSRARVRCLTQESTSEPAIASAARTTAASGPPASSGMRAEHRGELGGVRAGEQPDDRQVVDGAGRRPHSSRRPRRRAGPRRPATRCRRTTPRPCGAAVRRSRAPCRRAAHAAGPRTGGDSGSTRRAAGRPPRTSSPAPASRGCARSRGDR